MENTLWTHHDEWLHGQISSRPHTTEKPPQKVAFRKGNGTPYFQGNLGW